MTESIFCQMLKMSESQIVRMLKMSESQIVRILQNQKISEAFKTGKCQNLKTRIFSNRKMSE